MKKESPSEAFRKLARLKILRQILFFWFYHEQPFDTFSKICCRNDPVGICNGSFRRKFIQSIRRSVIADAHIFCDTINYLSFDGGFSYTAQDEIITTVSFLFLL